MPLSALSSLRRVWQPRRGLFWLMLFYNGLSSTMTAYLHWAQPTGWRLAVITALALCNALTGWWLLARLWREGDGPAPGRGGEA